MKKNTILLSLIMLVLFFNACSDKTDPDPEEEVGKYENSALIINEGGFGIGNADVSILSFLNDTLYNDVFNTVNGRPLGDLLQSMYKYDTTLFMILNGSGKIEVASSRSLKEMGVVDNLGSPRYMTITNNKAFVSVWNGADSGFVAIVDPIALTIIDSIEVGTGPEGIIAHNNLVWVANVGGWGVDSTISIINPSTYEIEKTLTVGHNPSEFIIDKNDNLWVICGGGQSYQSIGETPSKLVQIDPENMTIIKEIVLSETQHYSHIDKNPSGDIIYYAGGYGNIGIYSMSINSDEAPSEPLIGEYLFYGFNVDPNTGEIYGGYPPSFTEAATLYRYSGDGVELNSYAVGVGTNGVIFN